MPCHSWMRLFENFLQQYGRNSRRITGNDGFYRGGKRCFQRRRLKEKFEFTFCVCQEISVMDENWSWFSVYWNISLHTGIISLRWHSLQNIVGPFFCESPSVLYFLITKTLLQSSKVQIYKQAVCFSQLLCFALLLPSVAHWQNLHYIRANIT